MPMLFVTKIIALIAFFIVIYLIASLAKIFSKIAIFFLIIVLLIAFVTILF